MNLSNQIPLECGHYDEINLNVFTKITSKFKSDIKVVMKKHYFLYVDYDNSKNYMVKQTWCIP